MPLSLTPPLLALLVVGGASASPSSPSSCEQVRHIELTSSLLDEEHEVCIRPGRAVVFLFSSAILPEQFHLEGQERFSRVEVQEQMLVLLPVQRYGDGERHRLSVRFKDGAAPAEASFLLVGNPAQATHQVEVFRHSRPVESYQAQLQEYQARLREYQTRLSEAEAEARQWREESERQCSAANTPTGLTSVIVPGSLEGLRLTIRQSSAMRPLATNHVRVRWTKGYRTLQQVAVEMQLQLFRGEPPWKAGGARLRGSQGQELAVNSVWQECLLTADRKCRVVVEATITWQQRQDRYTLTLREEGGERSVTVKEITFIEP